MHRFLRRTIYGLLPATLAAAVLGVPTATPALGLQDVNLACNDGTDLSLTLSTTELSALTDAVSAINLFPAGDPALACSLAQPTLSSLSRTWSSLSPTRALAGSGNPHYDYVVGGGRIDLGFQGTANFSLSVHAPATADGIVSPTSGGTMNFTNPGLGTMVAKPECLVLDSPTMGEAIGTITHATGIYADFEETRVEVDFVDSTMPGGTLDRFAYEPNDFEASFGPCNFDHEEIGGSAPITSGNITVHDADG